MRYALIIFFTSLFFYSQTIIAQYYDTGQDPASLKWMQIKTGRFRIIYPETYGSGGKTYAKALDEAFEDMLSLYPDKKFKIPVIIHPYTTQSNGYVAWAPRRMELYPTPEQNTIPLDPVRQLALHELTHVFQMEALNRGFSKGMSIILGEQFTGISAALLPLWFLEGDAVFAESVLTESGRGRSASFAKELKAISLEKGKMYKYDKMVNGSFRNFIPDHYRSGFQMVTWSYLRYNPQIWNQALNYTANLPFTIDPVNLSLMNNSGLTKRKLFYETFDTLKTVWSDENRKNDAKSYEILNPSKGKGYINYYSPVKIGKTSYAAIKTSLSDPPEFVVINSLDKSEVKIHVPGVIYPYFLSSALSYLVWVENQRDPRWENRNYSVIKLMDIRDRTFKQLTWKTRFMSASISPDGKLIAATENSIDNKNNLVLLDVRTEKSTASYPVPGNAYIQRPQWSDDGSRITAISLTSKGEGIIAFRLTDKSWETLLEEGKADYQSSFLRHDSLFFVSSSSGTENIFVLTPEKRILNITNSRYGATDLLLDGNNIVFSDYTASGNNLCHTVINNSSVLETKYGKSSSFLIDRIGYAGPPEKKSIQKEYTPVRYRKWQHLFRFHSWMPFYANLEEIKDDPRDVKPGFAIMSQNQLSTLITTLGYEYSDSRHKFHSQLTWQGWYPVFESRIDYGESNDAIKLGERIDSPETTKEGLTLTNSISVPLTFSSGKYFQYLRPAISVYHQNRYIYIKETGNYDYGQTQISARFYFSNFYKSAIRDIYPRWAQSVDFNFSFYPDDRNIYGSFITLRTALYVPGLFKNNGLRIRYENDKQMVEKIPLMNRINYPRSYKNIVSEELGLFSVDYFAPLFYPDFNISSLFYLTRIRMDLFYDYAGGTGNYYLKSGGTGLVVDQYHNYSENFSSLGFELMSDFYVFRLPYMVSAGVQAAWQKGNKSPFFELLFNIDIFGMNIGKSKM